jgi:hypothetical protein
LVEGRRLARLVVGVVLLLLLLLLCGLQAVQHT